MKKKQSERSLIAVKPNFLIGSKDGFKNIYEYRILIGMLYYAYEGQDISGEFLFDVKYVMMGKTDGGDNYKALKAACDSITSRNVNLLPDNVRGFKFRNVVSIADYEPLDRTGKVNVAFNPYIIPHIYNMFKKNSVGYTKMLLKYTLPIRSLYSVRLYEYLLRNKFRHEIIIPLDELRNILGVPETAFSKWYELDRNVLKVALKNLKKHTQISFKYKGVKDGRKVGAVAFEVLDNIPESDWLPELELVGDTSFTCDYDNNLEHIKIVSENIWEKSQQEVLDKYSKGRIKYYYKKLKKTSANKKINDPKAYFYVLLKNDEDNYEVREQVEKVIEEDQKIEAEARAKKMEEMEKNKKQYDKTLSLATKYFRLLSSEDQNRYMNSREIAGFITGQLRLETAASLLIRDNPLLFENNPDEETFLKRYKNL